MVLELQFVYFISQYGLVVKHMYGNSLQLLVITMDTCYSYLEVRKILIG